LSSGAKEFFFGFGSGIFCLDTAFHISAVLGGGFMDVLF
jgi:hypothetical protein